MIDSCNSLTNDRLVVNVQTKCNIPQALAEGLIKDVDDPKAQKQSSDYMEKAWIYHKRNGISIVMDVEDGSVAYLHEKTADTEQNKVLLDRWPVVELKEHEFSHNPLYCKQHVDQFQLMWSPDRPEIDHNIETFQQRFIISNRDQVSGKRLEYYQRSPINWNIMVSKVITDHVKVSTVSRKCELHIEYRHDWTVCNGALVKKSTDNKLDHFFHIKDDWS